MPSESGVPFSEDSVHGFLHRPNSPNNHGLVLTHGAGGNCNSPLLIALANAFAAEGILVLRCDLPFRQRRPTGPPFPAQAKEDREGLRQAVKAVRAMAPGSVYLGGHSYGGRQASILASESHRLTERLLLLSYPLHPPQKPEQLRTAHFKDLRTPCLFVQGTKDPFGSLEEMRLALSLIPSETTLLPIAGAGHDLGRGLSHVSEIVDAFRSAESLIL